jgi:glycosyltransferase involved in cell wall biosynthesis
MSSRTYVYLLQHGFPFEQLIYIPNGVDTRQFYPLPWLRDFPPGPERAVICVARLEYAKGVDVLLRAWATMWAFNPGWRADLRPQLYLVGDGSLRSELEDLVSALGIAECVEFLGTRRDIAALLRESWAFVLPSRWEGMPNALLEAMATALPCVATRVSGSEDIVLQGVSGLLVEPEQPEKLAYALKLVLEDTHLANRLGQCAYKQALHNADLGITIQISLAFYRFILGRSTTHRDMLDFATFLEIYAERWQINE